MTSLDVTFRKNYVEIFYEAESSIDPVSSYRFLANIHCLRVLRYITEVVDVA